MQNILAKGATVDRLRDLFQDLPVDPSRGLLSTLTDLAVDAAMSEFSGDVRRASEFLGVSHQTLYRNLARRRLVPSRS